MKPKRNPTIFFFLMTLLFTLLTVSCGDEQENAESKTITKDSDSFTFFTVGKNSILSKNLRRSLNQILGDDTIERRDILDLEIYHKGFLKKYFPDLDKLNRNFNSPPGERVEHKIVKLVYRYALQKNTSFDYVELIFSEYTQTPVLIRIHSRQNVSNILETLKKKYGSPEIINWNRENPNPLYWRKNRDLLILGLVPYQLGNPKYQIVIYFTEGLEKLLKAEQKEKEKKRQQRTKSDNTAF